MLQQLVAAAQPISTRCRSSCGRPDAAARPTRSGRGRAGPERRGRPGGIPPRLALPTARSSQARPERTYVRIGNPLLFAALTGRSGRDSRSCSLRSRAARARGLASSASASCRPDCAGRGEAASDLPAGGRTPATTAPVGSSANGSDPSSSSTNQASSASSASSCPGAHAAYPANMRTSSSPPISPGSRSRSTVPIRPMTWDQFSSASSSATDASAMTEDWLTGPPTNTTRGLLTAVAQSPMALLTVNSLGRLSTTPSAPSPLCSSIISTVWRKLGSDRLGAATRSFPRVDSIRGSSI